MTWRAAAAAVVAAVSVAGVVGLDVVFVRTAHGQLVDEATRDGGSTGSHVAVASTAQGVLEVVSASTLCLAMLVVVAIALVQRRRGQALAAGVLLAGANLTTQLLKHVLLTRPTLAGGSWPSANSLPSGHTTFAASVSAAVLVAVPVAWRPVTAVAGAAWTALTGAATLALHWHRVSDVAAAVLVVGAWTAIVTLATELTSSRSRRGPPLGRGLATAVLLAGAVVGLGIGVSALAAVWVTTPPGLRGMFGLHVAFAGGAFAVGGLTCLVMCCQMHLVSQPRRSSTAASPGGLTGAGQALSSSGARTSPR